VLKGTRVVEENGRRSKRLGLADKVVKRKKAGQEHGKQKRRGKKNKNTKAILRLRKTRGRMTARHTSTVRPSTDRKRRKRTLPQVTVQKQGAPVSIRRKKKMLVTETKGEQ